MNLAPLLNILMADLDRWKHLLLLLKGKVNISEMNIVSSAISMQSLLPVEVPQYSSIHINRIAEIGLKRRE